MPATKKYNVGPETRKRYDAVIRKAAQEAGAAVETMLDKRYSDGKSKSGAKYFGYERYLLSSGKTLFFSLKTEEASVSVKPNKFAQAKVEKREKRKADRAAKKAAKAVQKK